MARTDIVDGSSAVGTTSAMLAPATMTAMLSRTAMPSNTWSAVTAYGTALSPGPRHLLQVAGHVHIGPAKLRKFDRQCVEALDQAYRIGVGVIGHERGQSTS